MKSGFKLNIRALGVIAVCAMASGSWAQNTQSGYFVEDYTYRYEMNPAIDNSANFIAMPALGNMNVEAQGNLHLSNLIYNVDGRTTTFMNPGVGIREVMDGLHDNNRIGANVKLTLLAAGFNAFGGYNTVTVNARAEVGAMVPRSLFSLAKEGVTNRTYGISNLRAMGTAYGEVSLGHSRALGDKWRFGVAAKLLIGGGRFDANMHRSHLTLGENDWTVVSDADVNASVKGLRYKTKVNDRTNHRYVNGVEVDGAGVNGFGFAFDLGTVYKPSRDWTLSLAVTDVGFIHWKNDMLASTCGEKVVNTDKYIFNVDGDADNSFRNEWEVMRDDLSQLYELEDIGDRGARSRLVAATLTAGVEYTMPFYRKLSMGVLNTTRINGPYSYSDVRVSANIAPVKCLAASVNFTAGSFGVGFGWLLNLHTKGFNMFVGMDRIPGKLTKQYVPLNSNTSVNFGLNFPF